MEKVNINLQKSVGRPPDKQYRSPPVSKAGGSGLALPVIAKGANDMNWEPLLKKNCLK